MNAKIEGSTGFNFQNSYTNLSKFFYSRVKGDYVENPRLVIINEPLAEELGLNVEFLKSKEGTKILSGSTKAEGGAYIAQGYCGHQFGHFAMLGDGRAMLIGEQITPKGERYDIQLKGSGRTPYSRHGDGKAALGPMIREYIISEGMYHLGIPTTRSLAVVRTNEPVYREDVEHGAVLARVAESHLRFGTFQYVANQGKYEDLEALADYAIERHYNFIHKNHNNNVNNNKKDKKVIDINREVVDNVHKNKDEKLESVDYYKKYREFLYEVMVKQAYLVAKWKGIGFIHGVMNTDNMSICGETIDYGPCAFMDVYNYETVFSSIDTGGRYCYGNQHIIAEWNLCRFAESLLPLLADTKAEAIEVAQGVISQFGENYYKEWMEVMRRKIGIFNEELQDKALIEDLLDLMEKYQADFTNTFLSLTFDIYKEENLLFNSEEFKYWMEKWQERLERQEESLEESKNLMKANNPAIIPRNHRVEEAISAAEKGNYKVMGKLLEALKNPYDHREEQKEYSKLPPKSEFKYKTYCGT